jgi:tetratricopeptide (TPR) repeat protein
MPGSQPNYGQFPFWNKLTLPLALLLAASSACSDPYEEAARRGAEADQLYRAGNLTEARERISEALRERDDVPELHILRGRIEFAAGERSNALDAYTNALALDNANMEALQAISQLGLNTGRLRESLEATGRILSVDPRNANALIIRGVHAIVQRQFEEAIGYADRVLELNPNSEEGAILRARGLFLSGKPDEALRFLASRSDNAPETEGIALTKLEIYRELRDSAAMQDQFEKLRTLRPADPVLRIDEANLLFKLDRQARARSLVAGVLSDAALDPRQASSSIDLLEAYGARLTRAEVARIARTASPATRAHLARHFLEAGDSGAAQTMVARIGRSSERTALEARVALLEGARAAAVRKAGTVLAQDKTQCDALVALAGAKLEAGEGAEALSHSQLAAAECPQRRSAWLLAAQAHQFLENEAGTRRVFQDALAALPQDLVLTTAYSSWLLDEGRTREALAAARRLVREAPALEPAWKHYEQVCKRAAEPCAAEARRGAGDARSRYWIDLRAGELPPQGLFGRLVRRAI